MSTPTTLRGVPTYADFVSKVDDLYGHLEELHFIDQVLDYLDVIEANRELQFLDNLTLQQAHYTVHLGSTHPFTREVPLLAPPIVLKQRMIEARSSASAWASAARREALHAIDPWIASYGHYFETGHTTVVRARDELMFVSDDFAKLDHSIEFWRGPAADDFASNFYNPADQIRDHQTYALEAMRCAIVFADDLTNLCKHSLMNAIEAADECAVKQLSARARDERGSSSAVFKVLSAAASIASAIKLPNPGTVALTIASVAFGAAASTMDDKDTQDETIEAASADQLDAQLHQAIGVVNTNSGRRFNELEAQLEVVQSKVDEFEAQGTWFTREPKLIDGAAPGAFIHQSRIRS